MLELCSVLSVIHTLSLGNVVLIFMIQNDLYFMNFLGVYCILQCVRDAHTCIYVKVGVFFFSKN